jgi:surface polysaccharide O-acyltransferase-like enzyme
VAGSIAFGSAFGADEAMVPLAYLSPTTILATLALFVLFRTWLGPERPATARAPAWVGTIAAATFGVYLLHPIVLDLWRTVIPIGAGRFSVLVVFPASVAVVGAASLVVVLVARQIPLVRRLVP